MTASADVTESDPAVTARPARGRAARWAIGRTRPGARRKPRRAPGTLPRWAQDPEPVGPARQVAGTMFTILAVALIGFAVWLSFGSRLYFSRVQVEAYETLRVQLANGTAPVGPTNPYNPNQLVAPGTPVAVLKIPALHMQDVVMEGTTGQVMEGGPGHVRDTPLPGQQGASVILGRRAAYGAPFAGLGSLAPGDPISVATQEGVAKYQVIDIRRAGSPLPPPLAAGSGRLVLVTADGVPFDPTGEVYVDASLVGQPFATPPQVLTSSTLPADENAMGTDTAAWVPLVFWAQLLLLVAAAVAWLSRAWGRWQTWLVGAPVLTYLSIVVADEVTRLLPNIL
jgi:LPXTG-site transpeptidase (sortase) family protein